jgi:hypothetical protein
MEGSFGITRKLLSSTAFNVETETSAFEIPCVNIFHNLSTEDVEINVKQGWLSISLNKNIPLEIFLSKCTNLKETAEYYLKELIPTYTKPIKSIDHYTSPYFKKLLGDKNDKQE